MVVLNRAVNGHRQLGVGIIFMTSPLKRYPWSR